MENKTTRILRLILYLSCGYPKSKEECKEYLCIGESSFFNYCNLIKDIGFDIVQKDGSYWISNKHNESNILSKLLYFSEEEGYVLSKAINNTEGKQAIVQNLHNKLNLFLNHDESVKCYINKNKDKMVKTIFNALKEQKQVVLVNYSSGNSQSIRNRTIEPFEFKDDFNLVWGFDIDLEKNRQFKLTRIQEVIVLPIVWRNSHLHRSLPVDVFRNTGDLNKRVEFEMNLRAKNLLIEEYPLSEKYLVQKADNQFLFTVMVSKYEGPARFVLGVIDDVKVIGDNGFWDFLIKKIEKIKKIIPHHETWSSVI